MAAVSRRDFLAYAGRGAVVLATVGAGATFLTACDPLPLQPPDANGLRLPKGSRRGGSRPPARPCPARATSWHSKPDGGACFPLADGGWSYVSNSECIPGGAGFVRFDATGRDRRRRAVPVRDDRQLRGRRDAVGHVVELRGVADGPGLGVRPDRRARRAGRRPAMGAFPHEAAAADAAQQCVYLTEDRPDGALYRFVPTCGATSRPGRCRCSRRRRARSPGRPSRSRRAPPTADARPGRRTPSVQRRRGRRDQQGPARVHDQGRRPRVALRPGRQHAHDHLRRRRAA